MSDTPIMPPKRGLFTLSPLNQRRWRNFTRNRRAYWSLIIFSILFGLSLFAEFIANDKPIVVNYRGDYYMPIFNFYPETAFGGDFQTEAQYRDIEVKCLITTGGLDACFDDPEALADEIGRTAPKGHRPVFAWVPADLYGRDDFGIFIDEVPIGEVLKNSLVNEVIEQAAIEATVVALGK